MKVLSYILLLTLFLACHDSSHKQTQKATPLTDKIISAGEVNAFLSDGLQDYIIIDVSKPAEYNKGHIPSALNLWRGDYGSDKKEPFGGLMASHTKIQSLMRNIGVMDVTTLLLYDHKGNVDALRFAWVLEFYGFKKYKIISGGFRTWELLGLPVSLEEPSTHVPSSYNLLVSTNNDIIASLSDVKEAIKDTAVVIVDTREDYEYRGDPFISSNKIYGFKKGSFDRGHIPGALHFNWSMMVDLDNDHKLKSIKDLLHDTREKGITPDKEIIVYCQSGSRSAHTFFVLKEVLGFKNVKNYDGSWIEWSYNHKRDSTILIDQITSDSLYNVLYSSLEKEITNG